MDDTEKRIAELERRIERIETMLNPSPLSISLKTAVCALAAIVAGYIVFDVVYTFIIPKG